MGPIKKKIEIGGAGCYLTERKFGKQFLGYLYTLDLKDAILGKNLNEDKTDTERNEEAYAELVQFLDATSLSLMKEASDNRREVLRILHDHYAGNGKLRIISLYTKLMSIEKGNKWKCDGLL